jgi:hypothetical protein
MNNEQQELLSEAYENYVQKCNEDKWMKEIVLDLPFPNKSYGLFSHEEFINKCKTDPEFSKKWGLKIEERELSYDIRFEIFVLKNERKFDWTPDKRITTNVLDELNIPNRLITITYNDKTIESYE